MVRITLEADMFTNEINVLVSDLVHACNVHVKELHWLAAEIGPDSMVSDALLQAFARDDGSISRVLGMHLPTTHDDMDRFHENLFHKARLGWLAHVVIGHFDSDGREIHAPDCHWVYADDPYELVDQIHRLTTDGAPQHAGAPRLS